MTSSPTRRQFLKTVCATAAASTWASCRPGDSDPRPNIVLIMADDLGIDGIGCYGGESFATPRIDRLAAEGTRFECCYATPLCTPSRVELLTGRYPFRTGWTNNIQHLEEAAGRELHLRTEDEVTFAQLLRDAGYETAIAGKWQLARFDAHPRHLSECGFDESCCWMWKSGEGYTSRYWSPVVFEDGAVRADLAGVYGPDLFAEAIARFVRSEHEAPFLAFYSMTLPHGPFEPTPRQTGGHAPAAPVPALGNFGPMVEYLDELVGRIVDALDEAGLASRTLVLFTSDNGTPPEVAVRFRGVDRTGEKGRASEAGMRVPLVARWPGRVPAGRTVDDLVDFSDFLPTFTELGGATLPASRIVDGVSFASVLTGDGKSGRQWAFSQVRDRTCIRVARYKLYDNGRLFDVVSDPAESDNLIAREDLVGITRRLQAMLDGVARGELPSAGNGG